MESSKKGGMLGGAEKLVAKFSEEQKRIFSNLLSVTSSKSVSSSSSSRNQGQNIVKPPQSLDDSIISSDDDCVIIDISEDDEKEVMLEDVSSEISNGSRKDENGPDTEPKVESQDESESEKDWEVITIEDDDDDKPKIPPERMICYRCPNKKLGAFKDVKKYFAHIKRHVFYDHFACPHCKRPFLKLNYCISHELRVHGSSLEFEIKDPVISMAKNYVISRKAKMSNPGPSTQRMETDEEVEDCEDVKFYENRFVKSSAIYPYRGPPVTSVLESYEIQNFQHRKKANRINGVARIALTVHKQNVDKEQDSFKLGKFSGRKGQRGKIADPNAMKPVKPIPKKKPSKPRQTAAKRVRETASESEINAKEQPKKKRVRYAYITSSSSSPESDNDNTTDADYAPKIKIRYDEQGRVISNSQHHHGKVQYMKALPPIMERKCVKCKNFEWTYPVELRSHRDVVHPNIPLIDLVAVLLPVTQSRRASSNKHVKKVDVKKTTEKKADKKAAIKTNEKIVPGPSKKAEKKVAETTKKESKARKTANAPKKGEKKTQDVTAKKRVRIQRKCKSKGSNVPKSQFPQPDSTFSQKELFLHSLGLSSCVRLHLHEKKPIEDLNLPPCSVLVQKLSDLESAFYSNRGSMSSSLHNLLQGHFLAS